MCLFIPRKSDDNGGVLYLLSLGFLSMGILDCFHAASPIGKEFVFLRSIASLLGGVFFSAIWFPRFGNYLSKQRLIIWLVLFLSVSIGVVAFVFPSLIPPMLNNGKFTWYALSINYLSGLLFMIATIKLFVNYLKSGSTEVMILFLLSFLFAFAGFTFNNSELWDGGWWLWHLMRLIAYIFVLHIVSQQYINMVSRLKQTIIKRNEAEKKLEEFNVNLEKTIDKRTKELFDTNQQLQANEQQLRASNQQLEAGNQQLRAIEVRVSKLLSDVTQTKNLLETVINSTPDWIYAKDINFKYILVNKGYASALGKPPKEFIGKDDVELGFSDEFIFGNTKKNIVGVRNDDIIVLGGKATHNPNDAATSVDGVAHIFDTIKIPLKDKSDNIYAALGFARDITDLKKTEDELKLFNLDLELKIKNRTKELSVAYLKLEETNENLRASETRFRILFEESKVAYLLIVDGEFIDCNKAATDMLGFTKSEILTSPDLISPEYQPVGKKSKDLLAKYINKAKNNGWAIFEWVYLCKDGSRKTMEITLTSINIAGADAIFTAWHDITKRKESERKVVEQLEEIKKINKKLENYSYTISHDLKEPIRSIRAFSEFISEDYADTFDDEAKDYFSRIIRASNKMALMIDDMLILSRVGRVDVQFSNVQISKIIDEVEEILHHALKKKKAQLVYDDMPTIICQPIWMKAVFQNLVANSINYTNKEKTTICIKYVNLPAAHEFSVTDNGRGIDKNQFKKIFGLFRKANQDKNSMGSGAGLAIVTTILEQHRGKVWVAESTMGVGTTIKFTISKNLTTNKIS